MTPELALLTASGGKGQGGRGVAGPVLPHSGSSPAPPPTGLALLCCTDEVQSALLSVPARKVQGQLTCPHDPRTSSPGCCRWQGVGQHLCPCATPLQISGQVRFPHSHSQSLLTHICHEGRLHSAAWLRPGPTLLSNAIGKSWGQLAGAPHSVRKWGAVLHSPRTASWAQRLSQWGTSTWTSILTPAAV